MNLAEIIYSIYMYLPLSTLPYNNMDKNQWEIFSILWEESAKMFFNKQAGL